MRTKIIIAVIIIGSLLLSGAARASHYEDARSLALAKSFTSLARGYQSIGINPANMALDKNGNMSLEIFSVGANLNNNSFSLSDYNKYNGEYLTQADKDYILSRVPDNGLEGAVESGLSTFSMTRGSIAFGITGDGDGRANIDKQVLELIFNGNTIGDSMDISNALGTGIAHVDFNLSYASKLTEMPWGTVNWGVNVKYIYGIAYMNIEEADAYLATHEDGINSGGAVQVKTSEGGSGFGMDLGFSANYNDRWNFSLALTNFISKISWSKKNKLNTYLFTWSSLTLENSDEDSVINSDEIKESIGSFSAGIAPQLALGASTSYKSLLLSFDYKQGLKNQGRVSSTPELAVGCEASFLNKLPVRLGFSVGGVEGSSSAVGFGFRFRPFFMDFAYMSTGSLIPIGGQGLGLACSSGFMF